MYSINGYGDMITDAVRMGAYARALRQVVKPGTVVLDIGTGTGVFALLACRMGARRVYAIESSDAIDLAREIARDNGCAGSIEFIQGLSTQVELPERADVVVSDLRGALPFYGRHLPAIADARRRLMAPGGTLVARRDVMSVACVEAADLLRDTTRPWSHQPLGFDMRAALKLVTNQWRRVSVKREQMLSEAAGLGSIDYATVETPNFAATIVATASRRGTGHGMCAWFDADVADGVGFSNAPGEPELIYGQAFFPWPEPVDLECGDEITFGLRADLEGDDYSMSWSTAIVDGGGRSRRKAQFRQSSFFAAPLSPERIARLCATHVPQLNDDGRVDILALELMREGMSLDEIARRLARQFPERFTRWEDALTRAGELSARYGR